MVEVRVLVLVGLIVTTILAIGTVLLVVTVVDWGRRIGRQVRARRQAAVAPASRGRIAA